MEKTKRKHLSDLHIEHQLWTMEANFYADELKIYQHWLAEIAAKNTHEEVLEQVEYFHHQFMDHKDLLELRNNEVKAHEKWLANYAEAHPVAIDHRFFADHTTLRDHLEAFKKSYFDLKAAFRRFVDEWM